MKEISLVFEYRGTTYNESSTAVPMIGESIMIDDINLILVVTDVIHRPSKNIVYLTVKKKKS